MVRLTHTHTHTRSFSQSICSAEYFVFLFFFTLFFLLTSTRSRSYFLSFTCVFSLYRSKSVDYSFDRERENGDRFEAERVQNGFLLYFDEILSQSLFFTGNYVRLNLETRSLMCCLFRTSRTKEGAPSPRIYTQTRSHTFNTSNLLDLMRRWTFSFAIQNDYVCKVVYMIDKVN